MTPTNAANGLNGFKHIAKHGAFEILSRVSEASQDIQFKFLSENRVFNSKLKLSAKGDSFYFSEDSILFKENTEITIKINFEQKLYFLKTTIRFRGKYYYIDQCDNFYELIRRRSPRFNIPQHWTQTATIQNLDTGSEVQSPVFIIEMSSMGMKLNKRSDLPRFGEGQRARICFKMFRRSEVVVEAKIIHIQKSIRDGSFMGIEFIDKSDVVQNKIRNYCDDLAFYYAALTNLT